MLKEKIRRAVWFSLKNAGAGRFPFPIEGRIPNFAGAGAAAERLRTLPAWRRARVVKVNPDAPQHPVRAAVLRDGKVLIMPSPRLREGFRILRDIEPRRARAVTTLRGSARAGRPARLEDLRHVDLVVAGSVAVRRDGARVGKAGGYSDREYVMMRQAGGRAVPVVTTVHPLQVVRRRIPMDPNDVPLDFIITPNRVIETRTAFRRPDRILWDLVTDEDLEAIPLLRTMAAAR